MGAGVVGAATGVFLEARVEDIFFNERVGRGRREERVGGLKSECFDWVLEMALFFRGRIILPLFFFPSWKERKKWFALRGFFPPSYPGLGSDAWWEDWIRRGGSHCDAFLT